MVQVSEVIVGVKSDGTQQTKDDLKGVTDQTEETTEALGEQSGEMTDMAQSFTGALTTATVGLAAASAGLLSQVPVLGQLFDGLFAVVNSVALAMDQVLRPVLEPLSNKMFELSEAISEADSPMKTLVGILGTVAAVISGVLLGPVGLLGATLAGLGVGALLALINFEKFKQGLSKVAEFVRKKAPKAFKKLKRITTSAIRTAAKKIKQNLPKIVAAVVNLGGKLLSKFQTVISNTNFVQLGRDVMNNFVDAVGKFLKFAKPVVSDIMSVLEEEFKNYSWEEFGSDFVKFVGDAIKIATAGAQALLGASEVVVKEIIKVIKNTDWVEVGKDILKLIAKGIKAAAGFAEGAVGQAMKEVDAYIPSSPAEKGPLSDLDQAGPGLVNEFAGGITSNLGQLQSAGTQAADAADGRGQGGQLPGSRSTTTKVFLNGREVGRGTNSERFDESARRGQTF